MSALRKTIRDRLGRIYANTTPAWAYNPTMLAIRNGLLLALPLVMAGSIALLLNNLPVPAYQQAMESLFGPGWRTFGATVWNGTFGVLALLMLYSISQHLTLHHNQQHPLEPISPIITALVSFACLVIITPAADGAGLAAKWTGAGGLFVSIVTALLATRLFLALARSRFLHFSLYAEGADSAIPQAFSCLAPGIATIFVFAFIRLFFDAFTGSSVHQALHDLILYPFSLFQDALGTSAAYVLICQLLWFVGIHGANVLDPVTHQFYELASQENLAALAVGLPMPHTITKLFLDVFVYMGGAGSSLCLLAALLIASRNNGSRKLAQISLLPGVFNINELLLFGLPVILNPVFLIPFILVPLVLACSSYLVIYLGIVPGPSIIVDWTTPPIISGYIATGSMLGSLLQCFNLVLGTAIYIPFVRLSDRIKANRLKTAMSGLMEVACGNTVSLSGKKCLDREDEIGTLARALASDLQTALRTGVGLCLEYQPQINHITGRVIGAEALVRWRHPAYGPIPAPVMVAVSEDGDFIGPLGEWVLNEACAERRRWHDKGLDDAFEISVNVSVLQLDDVMLPRKIDACLKKHDLPPYMLGIEVTESVALAPDTIHNQTLHAIHRLGIGVSIDDFGMGHSSLLYLKHFPVSTLKIDKVLSKDVENDHTCAEIITTIVDLCHTLHVDIVVEFIENQEQITLLRELGCHIFQGYFFSKPLPGEQLLDYANRTNAQADAASAWALPHAT